MADQKLSALPVATTPSGTELIYLVQGGVSKQSTVSAIASTPTLQQVLTAGSTLAGNNTATGIGDLTLGTDDPGVYTSTIKTSGSTILHTSDNGVDTGLFTQTPTNNTFTKSVTALSFIKSGGTPSQFLKADGSVDSSTYLTTLGTAATSLTTTGSSGAATLISNVLNVPNYTLAGLGGTTLAAVNAQNLSVFAATTSSQLAGVISDETGSGALVFGTSPTFTTSIFSPLVNGASTASGTLTLASTSNATKGKILFGTSAYDEVNNRLGIGTVSPGVALDIIGTGSISNLLTCGQINAYTSNLGLYAKNANSSIFFGTNVGSNVLAQWNGISTSGAVTTFTFTTPAHTNQTTTTNIPNFRISGANKQWATGTVANQYWNYLTANTAAFVGASTMTNSYGLFVEAATAGTNATITNNFALGLAGSLKINDTFNIVFDTTTGTKIGTGTTQKLSFWNATPIVQPSAVTTVQGFYDAIASTGLIASGTITLPTGYGRSINNIAINTTGAAAANTDYYYFCTATLTFTLPTAVANTNTYYIKVTSGTLTINTTSSQTIDGSLTIVTSVANTAFTLISDGTNWQII